MLKNQKKIRRLMKTQRKKKLTNDEKIALGYEWVYTPYITKNGKIIYHPTGVFKFLADPNRRK